jgi:hypothetical protein
LLAAGVDLYAVARILRHTDPKVTFDTYAHLVPGYLHAQIDRLKLGQFAAPVLPSSGKSPSAPEARPENARQIEGGNWRALLDSNQWPSASETDALSN